MHWTSRSLLFAHRGSLVHTVADHAGWVVLGPLGVQVVGSEVFLLRLEHWNRIEHQIALWSGTPPTGVPEAGSVLCRRFHVNPGISRAIALCFDRSSNGYFQFATACVSVAARLPIACFPSVVTGFSLPVRLRRKRLLPCRKNRRLPAIQGATDPITADTSGPTGWRVASVRSDGNARQQHSEMCMLRPVEHHQRTLQGRMSEIGFQHHSCDMPGLPG